MNQAQIKRSLKLLSSPGIMQLLTDYTRIADIELLEAEIGSDADYARVVLRIVNNMKGQYRTALRVAAIVPQQRDL